MNVSVLMRRSNQSITLANENVLQTLGYRRRLLLYLRENQLNDLQRVRFTIKHAAQCSGGCLN